MSRATRSTTTATALLNEQIEQAARRGATILWCSPRGEDRVVTCDASYTLTDGHLERVL